MAGKSLGTYYGALGAGTFGAASGGVPPIGPDTTIETVADYAAMLAFPALQDIVFVVTDASGDPNNTIIGQAHYSYDLATGQYELIAPENVIALCDTDKDTCVEVERTADDDTIRFQANSTDVAKWTDTLFDITYGNYAVRNGSFLGFPGTGLEYINGTASSFISVNEVFGGPYVQFRAADTATGDVSNINLDKASWAIRSGNGATFAQMGGNKDIIDIDVRSGTLEINEGTTSTGTNTAVNGMFLELIDNTTGEAKRGAISGGAITPVPAWVNNALEVNGGVIQRGGALIKDTTVDGADTYSVDFTDLTSFNVTRGDFTLFNDTAIPFAAIAGVGGGYTTAGVNVYNYVTDNASGEAALVHNDTNVGGTTQLIRVNDSVASVSASGVGTIDGLECDSTNNQSRLSSASGATTSHITVKPDSINVDVESGTLNINEGTTASGTGTANAGDVLTLINAATGEAKYAPTGGANSFQATLVGAGATPIFVGPDPIGTFYTMAFDNVVNASPDFTLGGGGVLTCNTTRDYAITYDLTLNCIGNGTVYSMGQGLFVNGVVDLSSTTRSSHNDDLIVQNTTKTTIVSLTAGDTVDLRLQKLIQIGNRAAFSFPNQQSIYIQPA